MNEIFAWHFPLSTLWMLATECSASCKTPWQIAPLSWQPQFAPRKHAVLQARCKCVLGCCPRSNFVQSLFLNNINTKHLSFHSPSPSQQGIENCITLFPAIYDFPVSKIDLSKKPPKVFSRVMFIFGSYFRQKTCIAFWLGYSAAITLLFASSVTFATALIVAKIPSSLDWPNIFFIFIPLGENRASEGPDFPIFSDYGPCDDGQLQFLQGAGRKN